jgi:hypothetical protein
VAVPVAGDVAPLPYTWVVLEEWVRRLREMRLISIGSHAGNPDAPGGEGFGGLALTELGGLLVRWTVRAGAQRGPIERPDPQPVREAPKL